MSTPISDRGVADGGSEQNEVEKRSPLAKYAAKHWVTHAQFQSMLSLLRKAMENVFNMDKPYFVGWLRLHDIDKYPKMGSNSFFSYSTPWRSRTTLLYYAALCRFQNFVEHLVIKYPQHVKACGGYFKTPLFSALARRHF